MHGIVRSALTRLVIALVAVAFASAARADIVYASNAGGNIEEFPDIGPFSNFSYATTSGGAYGMAFDGAANLYVAETNNTIVKIDRTTKAQTVFANTGLSSPAGLAFDRTGNLYAANGDGTIEKFNSAGVGTLFASTGLSNPRGIAFDASDNLYVANWLGGNSISKFTPAGVGSIFATAGLSAPYGLAFDTAGNLYASNWGSGTIEKFTTTGVGSQFAIDGSDAQGMAFDSAGNLYVANQNNFIEEYTPSGVGSTFASSGLANPQFLAITTDAGVPIPLANQTPEPASLSLLALGGLATFHRRRRTA